MLTKSEGFIRQENSFCFLLLPLTAHFFSFFDAKYIFRRRNYPAQKLYKRLHVKNSKSPKTFEEKTKDRIMQYFLSYFFKTRFFENSSNIL